MAVTRPVISVALGLGPLALLDLLAERLARGRPPWRRHVDWLRLRSTTSRPLAAATSAMPEPMIPEPTIPTRVIDMGSNATGR